MANIMEKSSLDEIRIRDLECGTVFKFNDKWYIKSINHRGFRENYGYCSNRDYSPYLGVNLETGKSELLACDYEYSQPECIAKSITVET